MQNSLYVAKTNFHFFIFHITSHDSTSPTAQKILKLGGCIKGMWNSALQKSQMLMIYISLKF